MGANFNGLSKFLRLLVSKGYSRNAVRLNRMKCKNQYNCPQTGTTQFQPSIRSKRKTFASGTTNARGFYEAVSRMSSTMSGNEINPQFNTCQYTVYKFFVTEETSHMRAAITGRWLQDQDQGTIIVLSNLSNCMSTFVCCVTFLLYIQLSVDILNF